MGNEQLGDQHCSFDRGGVTDLLSNATRIARPQDEDPRPWLGELCDGAPDQVLTLLHEGTHHWCFRSVVGNALLHLTGRAGANAYAMLALRDDPPNGDFSYPVDEFARGMREFGDPRVADASELMRRRVQLARHIQADSIRRKAAVQLLRPLAEGLALFAEFDAVSGPGTQSMSPLAGCLVAHFGGATARRHPVRMGLTDLSTALLRRARTSPHACATKAGVLMRPARGNHGGYLTGYLTVKSLWRELCRRDYRLSSETDLALMYMRSFFYDDLGLAALILAAPEGDGMAGALAVENRLVERFAQFQEVTRADIRAFEECIVEGPQDSATGLYRPGIRRTEEEDRRDRAQLSRLIDHEASPPMGARFFPEGGTLVSGELKRLLDVRGLLSVCSVPVNVRRARHASLEVLHQGQVLFEAPPDKDAELADAWGGEPIADGAAVLDIVIDMAADSNTYLGRAAVVSRDRRVLAHRRWGPGRDSEARRRLLQWSFEDREATKFGAASMAVAIEWIVAEYPRLEHNVRVACQELDSRGEGAWGAMATYLARDTAAREAATEALERGGLRPLLGSPNLVQRAAVLGLLAAGGDAIAPQDAASVGINLDLTVAELRSAWEDRGFPPAPLVTRGDACTPAHVLCFL